MDEFTGQIDEAEIFDRALTPEDIAGMSYTERVLATEPVAYWPGDDLLYLAGEPEDCS